MGKLTNKLGRYEVPVFRLARPAIMQGQGLVELEEIPEPMNGG